MAVEIPTAYLSPGKDANNYADIIANSEKIKAQMEQLQKVIEKQVKERRENNVLIVGLEESDEPCKTIVGKLIKQKLYIS